VVTLFLIVEVPMALHLIITALLKLFNPEFLVKNSEFFEFSVQLLNFAVLLSYPINFFIYCRMSRAFRNAFTQLLCPSLNRSRQEGIPTTSPQLITKPPNTNNNNNNNNHLELNNTNIVMKNSEIEILPSSTVILNTTTAEPPLSLTPLKNCYMNNDGKKSSIVSLGKQRVLFRDDINRSANTRFTDL
jgi:hypothetical protein